ncbi:MAG TPA: hypothetical protein VGP77_00290 [Vicinamibacterales bacterium]|jgi:hypothetical protein|nr:hypothetical protein [Vicinamibacterales bacterium]
MQSKFAMITFLDGAPSIPGVPDNSLPGVPPSPGNALPGVPGFPDNSLPGVPGRPVHLPVYPFDPTVPVGPDNSLPGAPPTVDNSLPVPGKRYIVKWLACVGLILVPDNALPPTPQPK